MDKCKNDADKLKIKQKKGTWRRFVKLFPQCRLPWGWLIFYIILNLGVVNIGLNETDYTAQLFAGDTSSELVTKLIIAIVLNLLGSNLISFARMMTTARTDRNMRDVLFDKVMKLPMSYFKDENPRDAIYRIVANTTIISSTIILVILPLVTAGYQATSVFFRIFDYDWRLSIILLAFIPIQIFIAFIFGRWNHSLSIQNSELNAGLMRKLGELVTNIPLAKAFAKESKEEANGAELTHRLYKLSIKYSWLDQFKSLSETTVSLVQSMIMVVVGVVLLRNQVITTRAWVAFFLFSSIFSGAVDEFMMYWNNLKNIQGSADKIGEIMNALEEDESGEPCEKLHGDICFDDVCFAYEESNPVLTGVSCLCKDHSVSAILGVSGCGKTTLVNLLTRLYTPQKGKITIGGKSIDDYALADYRSQFVMVSQNSMLFSGTIKENVCYGNGKISDSELMDALKKAGAYEFVSAMPDGIHTVLEEYGNNLSGGQRQRLAMARALLSDAHYMILDEPTASMDAIAINELVDILKSVSENRCMIVIAHTAAVLPIADHVIVLENGTVSAEGEIATVYKENDFVHELLGKKVIS